MAADRGAGFESGDGDPVGRLRAAGLSAPVLIVADTEAISRCAPAWAAAFMAMGWTHRVFAAAGHAGSDEVAAIAAEAESLGAATLVAVGGTAVVSAVKSAAADSRLPAIAWEVQRDADH